jgi:aryl-alcohol dehydrogenase-like predicted oxidoreductase
MDTRTIGKLEVSAVGMGCMAFSHGYGKVPERPYAIEAIRAAVDAGCTFFDTAEAYGQQQFWLGHNEELVGEALAPVRDQVKIATKFGPREPDVQAVLDGEDLYALMRSRLDASRSRLGTDFVDLYYLHRWDERIAIERVAEVMGRFIDEGLIGGWGMSQVDTPVVKAAHEVTPVTAVQNLYNILERDCEETLLPYMVEQGIGLVPFSPVASGLLSGKIDTSTEFEKVDDVRNWVPQLSRENIAGNQPIIDVLRAWAADKGATPAQICLAWMLHKWPNVVPIPGSKNKGRILENLGAADVTFTADEFATLQAQLDALPVFGHRGHVEYQGRGFLNGPKNR